MSGESGARRLHGGGFRAVGNAVTFTFDGAPVRGLAGESLAASLAAAGLIRTGTRRTGDGQGVFCGMGVCQECVVTVDGRPGTRACMTETVAGLAVSNHAYAVSPPANPGEWPEAIPASLSTDVLVVGGGPAGLAAARAAALCGAAVTLVDERHRFGGQYYKQLAGSQAFADGAVPDRQYAGGRALIAEVARLGVSMIGGVTVWGAFGPHEIAADTPDGPVLFAPRRLVLATGAYERVPPFPGWTLPGVMTTGAVQSFLRRYRVAPGRRILIAGNGPLNLQVASELVKAGAEVVAVIEAAPPPGLSHAFALASAALESPDLVRDGIGYRLGLMRARVPVLHGLALVRAEGDGSVQRAVAAKLGADGRAVPGTERVFEADIVCAGYGFLSSNELARSLGCGHDADPVRGVLVARVDEDGRSTREDVFLAGDGAAMNGARAALAQGFLAGFAAARDLGRTIPAEIGDEAERTRRDLRRHLRFQAALWSIYAAPRPGMALADPATPICRCEGVTRAEAQAAIADGATTIGEVKRRTRIGMGRCQGRYCGASVAELLAGAAGSGPSALTETDVQAPRQPARPVPIGAIARRPEP